MNHSALRDQVNNGLSRRALVSMTAEHEAITSGLSTGSLNLNMALSGSPFIGFVWGRMVEIYGPEQSGKTTLTLHLIHEAQRLESQTGEAIPCLFVDAEFTFDPDYAENIGIDLENLSVTQPGCGEDALQEVEEAVKAGYKLIIIDSVAALTPRAELEGEMGASHVGLQARLMSQACRKLTGLISRSGAIVVFINQLRMKIGVMFGNPETTTGGNALKFYASYRLDVRSPRSGKKTGKSLASIGDAEPESVETGINTKIKVPKNKLYPPHRSAVVTVDYGKGINKILDIISFLTIVNAFKTIGKTNNVIKVPSKGKAYTATGLKKILSEPEVQKDIIEYIRNLEREE